MKIEVLHSQWGADGEVFAGGEHEIAKPTSAFLRLVASAEAAGAVRVVSATGAERSKLRDHVETDKVSVKNLAAAQADGRWHEGNWDAFVADVEAGVREPGNLPDRDTYVAERKSK